jgi:hypothetical protein
MADDKVQRGFRKELKSAVEQAELEQRLKLFRQRVDLVRVGLKSYHEYHKVIPAVKAFHSYLRILEEMKGVGDGGLTPAHFDPRKEIAELLLVSGIYWDLVKIYDRTKSPEKYAEFLGYMQKFVMFAKGMPYETVAAETMRKYIAKNGPMHKDQFKQAYKNMGGSNLCFVATSLFDVTDPETIAVLREFRDEKLLKSAAGRIFVRGYYRLGPWIAAALDRMPLSVRRRAGTALDRIASLVS